jgi:hypothetical protein
MAMKAGMIEEPTKQDIAAMLRDIDACPVAIKYFLRFEGTPREYWEGGHCYGRTFIVNSPASRLRNEFGNYFSYEEAIETLVTEWLVRTQCPDYWAEWEKGWC